MVKRRDAGERDPAVLLVLDALAAPAPDDRTLPGERAALEAFRGQTYEARRRSLGGSVRRGAGAVGVCVGLFLTSGTAAAAATGVLPDPAQHLAHVWFERVGISVPDAGGFLERDGRAAPRRVALPRQTRPPTPPSAAVPDQHRIADGGVGTPTPEAGAGEQGSREERGHEPPPAKHPGSRSEVSGNHGTSQPATFPGAAPAETHSSPRPTPAERPRGNHHDRGRDRPDHAMPPPSGASSHASPLVPQPDPQPPDEETRQRRPR